MREIFRTKSFWTVFVLASVVLSLATANLERAFRAQTQFLVIPRSEVAVKNFDQILSSLATLPESLPFYEKIALQNGDILDKSVAELPDYKKKKYWDSKIKTEKNPESGMIKITILDKDRFQVETLADLAKQDFIQTAGVYYDIKNDIDVRVIENPIIDYSYQKPLGILMTEGILAGFFLTLLSFWASFSLLKKREKEETTAKFERISFRRETSEEREKIQKKRKIVRKSEEEPWILAEKEMSLANSFSKKSAAPENLPVASEDFGKNYPEKESRKEKKFYLENGDGNKQEILSVPKSYHQEPVEIFSTEKEENEKTSDKKEISSEKEELPAEPIVREATPEEVKERLNKLLGGKM